MSHDTSSADAAASGQRPGRIGIYYTLLVTQAVSLMGSQISGYAVSIGENIPDASGFAAPYFKDGNLAGSITVTVPRYRAQPDAESRFGPLVHETAQALTRLLTAGPVDD